MISEKSDLGPHSAIFVEQCVVDVMLPALTTHQYSEMCSLFALEDLAISGSLLLVSLQRYTTKKRHALIK